MRSSIWTTADFPLNERVNAWSHALNATHLTWELRKACRDFHAELKTRSVGDLRLIGCRCDPCEGCRGKPQIGREADDYVGIFFVLSGTEFVRQGDNEALLGPGDFVIWDSRKAMEFRVLEPLHKMTILAPLQAVRRFLPEIDDIAGLRIDGSEDLGPLVGAHLRELSAGLFTLEDWQIGLIADATLELVAAGIGAKRGPVRSPGDEIYGRVRNYILERLADPNLVLSDVAAANGISLRYLHKLFSARGLSPARWILKERLKRCRNDLEADGLNRSVTEIAMSWGFNDSSHFSRSFRAEFGVPARALRRRVPRSILLSSDEVAQPQALPEQLPQDPFW